MNESQDRILTFHEKLSNFIENNLKLIFFVLVGFLILGILWLGISYYFEKKEKEATLKLISASNLKSPIKVYEDIIKKYSGTQAALQAGLWLWNYYYMSQNYAKLKELYPEIEKEYPSSIKGVLLYGKTKLDEEDKKYKEAIQEYKNILSQMPDLGLLIYSDLGRIYERLGDFKKALSYYKQASSIPELQENSFIKYKIWSLGRKK